ncbi:hypothetical protein SAMN05443662_0964 [Sulfurivirga caldicuralii]|uniref:Cytochrome c domain-containing protein n=1 Tax=Sulfurivirga caldicuralii TaxID=364032 RepID=A0A1N6F8C9_9GAMM|nr:hypothetical protein [Sulfurivirga caldicuralii]SIN91464.1 hypothetical protein SAMN05443662_0964 [Sulfurivirga caldicuralii]
MKPIKITLLLAGCITSLPILAETTSEKLQMGRAFFNEGNCMACHASRPFASETSRIKNYPALNTMVETCNTNLGLGWFPDEVEAVSHFLNTHYYKLPNPALANED